MHLVARCTDSHDDTRMLALSFLISRPGVEERKMCLTFVFCILSVVSSYTETRLCTSVSKIICQWKSQTLHVLDLSDLRVYASPVVACVTAEVHAVSYLPRGLTDVGVKPRALFGICGRTPSRLRIFAQLCVGAIEVEGLLCKPGVYFCCAHGMFR